MKDACGESDVDIVITTREFDRMLRLKGVAPSVLPEEDFDSPLGTGTGAAVVFGATGGVMDAALRSAYFLVTGKNPDADAFKAVRGMDGWKEAVFIFLARAMCAWRWFPALRTRVNDRSGQARRCGL